MGYSINPIAIAAATLLYVCPSVGTIIRGISAPTTASSGSVLPVTLLFDGSLVPYENFGIIWGLWTPNYGCDDCVGNKIGYTNLV